jgi:hypothetical protein
VELLAAVHVLAEGALEFFDHTMTEQVTVELVLPVEACITFLTGEGKLARVNQLVRL